MKANGTERLVEVGRRKLTTIYGIIYEHVPDEGILRTPCFVVPLRVVDVARSLTNCLPGLCFMKVIFTAEVAVPALGISMAQNLSFGREVAIGAELGTLLPHSTGLWGFLDVETGRIVGNGRFFETHAEAEAEAKRQAAGFVNLA
jgi:hypothetical protein